MLDFRYHALSLVAVFLALAIGIVLGVTIGDSLLSEAERGVRNSLRSDVVEAREEAGDAQQARDARDRFIERVAPALVDDRLTARRVALISWGAMPESVEDGVREAVRAAGGRIDSVSKFADPLGDLAEVVGEDQFAGLAEADALGAFGERLARALAEGGELTAELRGLDGNGYRGRYLGADAVAFFHAPPDPTGDERDEEDADKRRELEEGLLEGLSGGSGPVVGVEAAATDPTQVPFYKSKDLTSVDSVDTPGGQVALVFALEGADGNFGFKRGAEPIPEDF